MTIDSYAIWSRRLEGVAYWMLVAIVSLVPLPFGTNFPEGFAVLGMLSGFTLLLVPLSRHVSPERFAVAASRWLICAAVAFLGFVLWSLLQIVPGLSLSLLHPLWPEAATILGGAGRGTISIDPQRTLEALMKTCTYFALGVSSLLLLRDPPRRRTALTVLVCAASLYATYGLVERADGDCCVLWLRKTTYVGSVTGPFINRNDFATYLGLATLVCLALLGRTVGEFRHFGGSGAARWRAWLTLLLAREWWLLAALAVISAALLFTASRAGVTASLIGATVLIFLLSKAGILGAGSRGRHVIVFLLAAGVLIASFGGVFLARFANEGIEDLDRTQSWKIVITGIEASPWLGHGFGTFPESFPLYRDDRLASRRYWDKAQDTYLELALDTGIPATVVLLGGFAAMVAQCWKGLSRRRRERRIFPAIGIAATVLVGAHSIYDFSMQIPAIATTYAFIMGIALAESGIWRARNPDQSSAT